MAAMAASRSSSEMVAWAPVSAKSTSTFPASASGGASGARVGCGRGGVLGGGGRGGAGEREEHVHVPGQRVEVRLRDGVADVAHVQHAQAPEREQGQRARGRGATGA